MTINEFILSKQEFGFFFKPKGNIKTLVCGNLENGEFKSNRQYEFDESGNIKFEIGYQSGWTACPPGTMLPPPPIQYLRRYTYKNGQLNLISEEDKKSNELLKFYEFNYQKELLTKITETNEGNEDYSPKCTFFEYDLNGLLTMEKTSISSIGETKTYLTSEIVRNTNNQIVKIINSNSAELNGQLISKQEISTYKIEYDGNKVHKYFINPNHNKTYNITAELLPSNSKLVVTINYPNEFQDKQKVEYEYDKYTQNIKKKIAIFNDKVVTELYNYE